MTAFTVFEEIAQGFSGIDDEAFRAVQSKKRLADEVLSASLSIIMRLRRWKFCMNCTN